MFVRSAELSSSRPSLSFDSSPTQEIPLSRNDFFGIYYPIIPLKYFACGIDSNDLSEALFSQKKKTEADMRENRPLVSGWIARQEGTPWNLKSTKSLGTKCLSNQYFTAKCHFTPIELSRGPASSSLLTTITDFGQKNDVDNEFVATPIV